MLKNAGLPAFSRGTGADGNVVLLPLVGLLSYILITIVNSPPAAVM